MADRQPKHTSRAREKPPNPLDFPVKDPFREAYEGRWKQLPLRQKVGMVVVLVFCVLLTIFVVWGDSVGNHLIGLLPFLAIILILIAFSFVLGRSVRSSERVF